MAYNFYVKWKIRKINRKRDKEMQKLDFRVALLAPLLAASYSTIIVILAV